MTPDPTQDEQPPADAPDAFRGVNPVLRDAMTRRGFTELPTHLGAFALVVLLGVCSQFTGIFGALILLEPQENAYTVPVNRASSILAGVVSSFLAVALFGAAAPSGFELAGASIVVLAILALSWPLFAERARRRRGVVAA